MDRTAHALDVGRAVAERLKERSGGNPAVAAWLGRYQAVLNLAAQALAHLYEREPALSPQVAGSRISSAMASRFSAQPELAAWFQTSRPLIDLVAGGVAARLQQGMGPRAPDPGPIDVGSELLAPGARTAANLRAIELMASGRLLSPAERADLRRYSGWGGLSIEKIRDRLPPEWIPDAQGLLHEYYTPSLVCRAMAQVIAPRLGALSSLGTPLLALEPSAGVGRFLDAFEAERAPVQWLACELSAPSARILAALHPSARVFVGPFEQWVAQNVGRFGQKLALVASNPPYGERGASLFLDPDPAYRDKAAYVYFLRRTLDLLAKGGLGAYVIPSGFLTGQSGALEALRKRVLTRHHLVVAFRLPSEDAAGRPTFPGANIVTDFLLFRARGHELTAPPAEDQPITEGRYYELYPQHVLGQERTEAQGARWRYEVIGSFTGLPPFEERPECSSCVGQPFSLFVPATVVAEELPDDLGDALKLARRVSRYLSLYSQQTADSLAACARQQPEIAAAVTAWHAQPAEELVGVLAHAARHPELRVLSSVWGPQGLVPALAAPPAYKAAFSGSADDVGALARWMYRERRGLTLGELHAEHRALGGKLALAALLEQIQAAGFVPDGTTGGSGALGATVLLPEADYYSGALWPRYERALAQAESGGVRARARAERLLALINPASWVDIQTEPRFPWIPDDILNDFAASWLESHYVSHRPQLFRADGRVHARWGEVKTERGEAVVDQLLGYLNHDLSHFKPKRHQGETLDEVRLREAGKIIAAWDEWIDNHPEHQERLVALYNRAFRGFVQPAYDEAPLQIGAWEDAKPLRSYQNAGVRRLLAQRGGGLFFDVGLGKTRTILATLALARQEGWARRPVIVVPNSVIWNWVAELAEVLPDFRVVVIGSDKKTVSRGERKGQEVSDTDSPAERGLKWQRFKAGLYDVALVTYSSFDRTELSQESVVEVIRATPAVRRSVWTSSEDEGEALERLTAKKVSGKLSDKERKRLARLERDVDEIVRLPKTEREAARERLREERLAAEVCDPGERELDVGIAWTDIGCDFLVFDESHTGKNLWRAGDREGGAPRYLASPQEASRIAWQMFYRAALVRKQTGGTGIFLADATPAKNSPLELLSLLSILDSKVWERLRIADAEQFVTAFLKIEVRWVQNADLSIVQAPCVVGFRNLDQLREVLLRYGEFRTAAQVGLKLPALEVGEPVVVELDELQEVKHRQYLALLARLLAGTEKGSKQMALGIMTRLALVALHPDLDGQELYLDGKALPRYGAKALIEAASTDAKLPVLLDVKPVELGWNEAATHPSPESPKIDELARRVAAEPGCGHIVFCDILAAQQFIARRLVHFGVPQERIAFLNAVKTKTPLERQRIAEAFNAGKYTVVIANAVAYEGINLQRLTCAIWHADLPWEPATLQQRNGRGHRQGNTNERLKITYFLSERSVDMRRYGLISAKRAWMTELIENARNEANNPGAAVDLSPEDWLLFLARDKDALKDALAKVKADQEGKLRAETRRSAWGKVRGIAARFREKSRTTDALLRQRFDREMQALLTELRAIDPAVWSYLALAEGATRHPSIMASGPEGGIAVEGAVWRDAGRVFELGKLALESPRIYVREFTERYPSSEWLPYDRKEIGKLFDEHDEPSTWSFTLPEGWQEALVREIEYGPHVWDRKNWRSGSERFLEALWKEPARLLEQLRRAPDVFVVPLLERGDRLIVWEEGPFPVTAESVLPMTEAGLVRFRALLQRQAEHVKQDIAERCVRSWWGREL